MTTDGTSASRWRKRWRAWMRPPRRLKFTRLGKWYTGITLALGFAAINTGNNLLFLLLGLLLAGIVLSGVLSETTLRGLEVSRHLPPDARAGAAGLVGLTVRNRKPRWSSWAVVARDVTDRGEAGRSFVLRLGPNEARDVSYRWEPARRGRVAFQRVELVTKFPFGLFEKWREFDLEAECVVLPREVPLVAPSPKRSSPAGERPAGVAGIGTEFFALREARTGDDARYIHWSTSARRGLPVIVEREKERRRRISVLVDNRHPSLTSEEQLDHAAEQAAALVRRATKEQCEVAFASADVTVPAGAGPAHERRVLREIALLAPTVSPLPPRSAPASEVLEIPALPPAAMEAA